MIRLTAVMHLENGTPRALMHESTARKIIIGRSQDADFQIPLITVSREHALITEVDGIYTLEDLGSTHGTFVDGKPLESGIKRVLKNGDLLRLDKVEITVNLEKNESNHAADNDNDAAFAAAKAAQGILGRLGPAASENNPYLRVLSGPLAEQRFMLEPPLTEWSLGRSKNCECRLDDPNISRRHAVIRKDWHGFQIIDLDSKNGVYVGQQKIDAPRRLQDCDEIFIGPVQLVFVDPAAHLLDALKQVPGFSPEVAAPVSEPEPAVEITPEISSSAAISEASEEDRKMAAQEAELDVLAQIDPSFLQLPAQPPKWREWVFYGALVMVTLTAVTLVFLLF